MKKSLFACMFALCVITQQAFSAEPKSYTAVISYFIDSHVNTNYKKLNEILSDDASFKIPRQNKVIIQSRSALLNAMRKDEGVVQNCSSSYKVLAKTDALVIARVDFKYPGFVQQNFITIERGDGDNWKVTQVCKISENLENGSVSPSVTTVD